METSQQHVVKTVEHLLEGLQVPVTRQTIRQTLETHPAFPDLSSLTDALSEWGVETMAVRLLESHLVEISYPFIAHIEAGEESGYVVIEQVQEGIVTYFDPHKGQLREPMATFRSRWQGISLLTEATHASGESQYAARRKAEVITSYRRPFMLVAAGIFAVAVLLQTPSWLWIALLVGNIAGLIFCIALWSEQAGQGTFSHLKKLCGISSKTDCHQVVNSPAGKLFGWLSIADIGLVYFSGSTLTLIWGGASTISALLWLNIAALPYTLFSVSYQAFVIRKWCTLCLLVQTTLWLTAGLHGWASNWSITVLAGFSIRSFLLPGAALALVSLVWVVLKPLLVMPKTIQQTTKELARFKRSESLFTTLLSAQPVIDTGTMTAELVLGNQDAPVTITVVSNPFCGPCADAHDIIEKLLAVYADEIRVVERFAGSPSKEESQTNQVARHLIGLSNHPDLSEALRTWYSNKNYDLLQQRYPTNPAIDSVQVHNEHMDWCNAVRIEYTPTVFINGQMLPDLFTISDLLVHLRYVINRLDASAVSA